MIALINQRTRDVVVCDIAGGVTVERPAEIPTANVEEGLPLASQRAAGLVSATMTIRVQGIPSKQASGGPEIAQFLSDAAAKADRLTLDIVGLPQIPDLMLGGRAEQFSQRANTVQIPVELRQVRIAVAETGDNPWPEPATEEGRANSARQRDGGEQAPKSRGGGIAWSLVGGGG